MRDNDRAISYPRFAAFYTWMTDLSLVRLGQERFRRECIEQAEGVVLEVGVGGGQNFPFYNAGRVERLEACEPDEAMLRVARRRLAAAPVPITLTRAAVEALPFPDACFDCVVATLVFCSVGDVERGLGEIRRVLKPGGKLLLLEHVRSQNRAAAWIQDRLVPLTMRSMGNCHWNRDTQEAVLAADFQLIQVRKLLGGLQPVLSLSATRPPA